MLFIITFSLVCSYAIGKPETTEQLEVAVCDANERLSALHSLERQSVRSALIEERGRLCLFVCGLKPVMVSSSSRYCSSRSGGGGGNSNSSSRSSCCSCLYVTHRRAREHHLPYGITQC